MNFCFFDTRVKTLKNEAIGREKKTKENNRRILNGKRRCFYVINKKRDEILRQQPSGDGHRKTINCRHEKPVVEGGAALIIFFLSQSPGRNGLNSRPDTNSQTQGSPKKHGAHAGSR